jgi:MFS superfamily sulfate permease-like transporter
MALLLLTPLFHFIPKASLGAVVMCALLSMIDYEVILPMFKVSSENF